MSSNLLLADGTVVGRALIQFGDTADGFTANLTIYLPVTCPDEVLDHHLRHYAVEQAALLHPAQLIRDRAGTRQADLTADLTDRRPLLPVGDPRSDHAQDLLLALGRPARHAAHTPARSEEPACWRSRTIRVDKRSNRRRSRVLSAGREVAASAWYVALQARRACARSSGTVMESMTLLERTFDFQFIGARCEGRLGPGLWGRGPRDPGQAQLPAWGQ